jgi:hypothetical protein
VDDATNLAVRAASGVTSSSLNNAANSGNGLLGNGALGIGIGGGGGNAKLSRERKHRMREQATQKLSKAYHLDEIACSVATMQSASTLEEVAHLVLQRSPNDSDAKYVHFFHEKIPSRQLAECTSLQPLDEIIADRPAEGEVLRTRGVTKIFKEDYNGAARDLTEALAVSRYYQSLHKADQQQSQVASPVAENQKTNRWKDDFRLDEADQPSSLEAQLLFQRAGVYLTIACQHVDAALPPKNANPMNDTTTDNLLDFSAPADGEMEDPAEKEVHKKRLEARKIVKTHAKRALRDYVAFLAHLDYTPGLPAEITEEFVRKVNQAAHGYKIPRPQQSRIPDLETNNSLSNGQLSDALVTRNGITNRHTPNNGQTRRADFPSLPPPIVHQISALFSSTPPTDLPLYLTTSTAMAIRNQAGASEPSEAAKALLAQTDCHEALTYHPLLTDALYSLLLCHCLVQTSARELQRHAHMVARLARICDGYPIFQAARSPSRADWIEVLRRCDNWIQLQQSWETLCAPAPLPGQNNSNLQKETPEQKRERLKQQAIMEALEDDRVCDEASFHAAVAARQRRQEEEFRRDEELANGAAKNEKPRRWTQEDGKEYPISTERAQAIVRWVREAPVGGEGGGAKKKKRKSSKLAKPHNGAFLAAVDGLKIDGFANGKKID